MGCGVVETRDKECGRDPSNKLVLKLVLSIPVVPEPSSYSVLGFLGEQPGQVAVGLRVLVLISDSPRRTNGCCLSAMNICDVLKRGSGAMQSKPWHRRGQLVSWVRKCWTDSKLSVAVCMLQVVTPAG